MVIDQFSRRVTGFALFAKMPTSSEICGFLDRVTKWTDTKPEHIITDKGRQFFCETFKNWCSKRGVLPRFGAVGKHGSIAVLERFIRSMKEECARRILVPLGLDAMREDLGCYATWYNEHRPHQGLDGLTPAEVHDGSAPPVQVVRFEPRSRWPLDGRSRSTRARRIHLTIKFMEGRAHLPIVQLTRAA